MVGNDVIIDDPGTSAFPPAREWAANFTETLGPGDQVAGLRIGHQRQLKLEHIVFGEQAGG